ncbi:unnamed protein product, partial [Menidia menidia]
MLSGKDKRLIKGWFDGLLTPDKTDPFFKLCFKPQMKDLECPGIFLEKGKNEWTLLDSVTGKIIYMKCVKALNKVKLKDRKDTPWRDYFKVGFEVKPVWGLLYKPPLTKNVAKLATYLSRKFKIINGQDIDCVTLLKSMLFLLKTSEVDLTGLPPFYSSVINAWQTLKVSRTPDPGPGMWVFEEPLFNNDFLRNASLSSVTLRTKFVEAGMTKLGHLVNKSMDTLGDVINVRSSRLVSRIVEEVWQSLSGPLRDFAG